MKINILLNFSFYQNTYTLCMNSGKSSVRCQKLWRCIFLWTWNMNAFLNREEKMKHISKATPIELKPFFLGGGGYFLELKPFKQNIRTIENSLLLNVSSLILLPGPQNYHSLVDQQSLHCWDCNGTWYCWDVIIFYVKLSHRKTKTKIQLTWEH